MTELTRELDRYIELYSSELENIDCSQYEDYEFSKDYKDKMSRLLGVTKKEYKPRIKFTFKRALLVALVAILLTVSTIVNVSIANVPSNIEWHTKDFNIGEFSDHSVVVPNSNNNYKTEIEHEYSIDIPEKYYLFKEESVKTNKYIDNKYISKDNNDNYLCFSQNTADIYSASIDNEQAKTTEKKDKYNNSILVYNCNDDVCIIIWSNGEYIFQLSAEMSEKELMDVYYSVK